MAREWHTVWFFQPRTEAAENYSNDADREQTWVPWFALFLAPAATEAGLASGLIDARTDPDWEHKIGQLGRGDILAVSVMTGAAIRDALAASRIARTAGCYVVWGGPHSTLFPRETLLQSPAHAVVAGPGFTGLARLLAGLTGLPQVERPDDADVRVLTEQDDLCADTAADHPLRLRRGNPFLVSAAPSPDLGLISDFEAYLNPDVAIATRTTNFITSEGCTRRCTFCSEPQTSRGAWRTRPVDTSVATLDDLVSRSGANGIKLHDPNFFSSLERAAEFGERVATTIGLPWAATIHPADLDAMPDAALARSAGHGLCRVLVGLETPVPELIRLTGKRYDSERIPSMGRRLADVGIAGMFTFIVGWPGADPDHYQATIDAAYAIRDQSDRHQCRIHFLEPWPGTPIFRLLVKRGYTSPTTLEEWAAVDYYAPQHGLIHDETWRDRIREANLQLSPYTNA